MPRRQFVADLDKAQNGALPLGIASVRAGEDDGQIEFEFIGASTPLENGPFKITALVPDLSDYPKSHEYMIFGDDNAPPHLSTALQNVRGTDRKIVSEMLYIVSTTLAKVSTDKDGDSQMDHVGSDDEGGFDDSDVDIYDSDHEAFEIDRPQHNAAYATQAPNSIKAGTVDRAFRQRIRADLRTAKEAGFKVGYLGHLMEGFSSYVTLSVRIAKLGVSAEAMEAWQLEPDDYLTLIIQFPNGYKTNEQLQGYDALRLVPNIAMRVVAGKRYKPSLQEAIKAFTVVKKEDRGSISVSDIPKAGDEATVESSIRETCISSPLRDLLEHRLVPILRFRSAGMDWLGAESWYQQQMDSGAKLGAADIVPDQYFEPEHVSNALPDIVRADHYASRNTTQFSFPLLAMQFALRHFVRCTEFCLVCHAKLKTDVEAIKPYVCDNSLCLYQYMSLGLGPSIEHEVIAQPFVVDLLISFCYSSASAQKLKDFPDGLSLQVPPIDSASYNSPDPNAIAYGRRGPAVSKAAQTAHYFPTYKIGFDQSKLEIIFWEKPTHVPVRRGDWILLKVSNLECQDLHCRVADTTFFPTIRVDPPVIYIAPNSDGTSRAPQTPAATRPVSPANDLPNWVGATFQVYAQDFASLDPAGKCIAICRLLDTLPNVTEMRDYLVKQHPANLKRWLERVSPAALSLLRWIIASNRACIMQVDNEVSVGDEGALTKASTAPGKKQERCFGMRDYMQFRFAMGAPDKEQRFINEVRSTTARLNLKHPTLFAFHGSPLPNWHMIIREGLHYKAIDHGRAYGDGVYHAKDAQTSTGYSGIGAYGVGAGYSRGTWPNSVLKMSSALALNEIVNAPEEFTSQKPYYVVKQLDWIQTRYLFVQIHPKSETVKAGAEIKPDNAHPQDPQRTPRGISDSIIIPASAIKSSKTARGLGAEDHSAKNPGPLKKMKFWTKGTGTNGSNTDNPIVVDDDDGDAASVATDVADLEILFDEPVEKPSAAPNGNVAVAKKKTGPVTDFEPGTLDFSTLPLMPLPTYATPGTTKRLMHELKSLQKVMDSTPIAELGWYIDTAKIENVYQWVVELHSFHTFEVKGKPLPLAQDMKQQKITSIVLEIRFNKDFPFTPPYVRVIRPRFLSLAQGGGGHIVMGGAMCMELLTNTGWSSVSSMESVMMQIRMAIASEPFARLDKNGRGDYGAAEGAEGYIRACNTHGWQVPPGFKEMAYGTAPFTG